MALKHTAYFLFGLAGGLRAMATVLSEPITLRKKEARVRKPVERMNFLLHNILKINSISVEMLRVEDINLFFSVKSDFMYFYCCFLQLHMFFC